MPVEFIYESCYETGTPVRWRIGQDGAVSMGIAGIYTSWNGRSTGKEHFSFAMLTVNADGHPVFARMHRRDEEARMVVILHPREQDTWLSCPLERAPAFFKQWAGPLVATPDPLSKAQRADRRIVKPLPRADPETGEPF